MSTPDPLASFAHKLAACIRMLLSDRDGEVANAMAGIQRLLQTKFDAHTIADRIEKANGDLNDGDKQKIRAAIEQARSEGYAEGVKAAESKQHGTGAFRNTDGSLE
jgi:hypothetical protein